MIALDFFRGFKDLSVLFCVVLYVHGTYSDCNGHAQHKNRHLLPQAPACGVSTSPQVSSRIQGGQEADLGEFPWAVYIVIRYGGPWWKIWNSGFHSTCTGSLINERYILTAGHCFLVEDDPIKGVTVYAGEWDISTDPDVQGPLKAPPRLEVKTEKVIFHPLAEYQSFMYDVALVRSRQKITFNDYIKPICLPLGCSYEHNGIFTKLDMKVAGWGLQGTDDKPNRLRKLTTQIVLESKCSERWLSLVNQDGTPLLRRPVIPDTDPWSAKVCVRTRKDRALCSGDSGSSLMLTEIHQDIKDKVYVALGVLSFGDVCFANFTTPARPLPSVFTWVPSIMDWLLDNISE